MQPNCSSLLEQIHGIFKEKPKKILCICWANLEKIQQQRQASIEASPKLGCTPRVFLINFIKI